MLEGLTCFERGIQARSELGDYHAALELCERAMGLDLGQEELRLFGAVEEGDGMRLHIVLGQHEDYGVTGMGRDLVREEGIQCDFSRNGHLEVACKQKHFDDYARQAEVIEQNHGRIIDLMEMIDSARDGGLKALWSVGYDIFLTNPNTDDTADALRSLEFVVIQGKKGWQAQEVTIVQ